MRKVTCLIAMVFVFVMMTGTAFAWSDRSEGRPHQIASGNRESGIFVWHDNSNELHMRIADSERKHVYSGIIQTDGRFFGLEEKQLENGDYLTIDRDRNTIRFRFTSDRDFDGINFKILGGDTVDFDLYRDGKEISRKDIFVGRRGWHPWHNNFYLEK